MIGNHPVGANFVVGSRFVVGTERYEPLKLRPTAFPELVLEVLSADGATVTARDHLGDTHVFRTFWNMPPKLDGDRRILWFGSIPNGSADEVMALAAVLLARSRRYRLEDPLLLHIPGIRDDGGADARLVMPLQSDRRGWHGHEDVAGSVHGNAFVPTLPVHLPPAMLTDLPVPCLVVVDGYTAGTDFDAPSLVEGKVTLVAHLSDLDAVGQWMPEETDPMGVGTLAEIEYGTSRSIARAEPDEILVAAVPRPGSDEIDPFKLSVTGIKLHDLDDVNDWLPSFGLEAGLWLGSGIGWHDAGEDGAEWDATWAKATARDLERHGYDVDQVVVEIEGVLEVDVDAGTVAGWLDPVPETTAQ